MAVYTEPVFEEPEEPRRRTKYSLVLEPLKEHPRQWAAIGEYKSDRAAYQASLNLRHGRYKYNGDPEEWEFTSENHKVYARYIGAKKRGPVFRDDPDPLSLPDDMASLAAQIKGIGGSEVTVRPKM